MKVAGDGLIIIGENFNATRKIKITSPKVIEQDGKVGIGYTDLDGNKRLLDVTSSIPEEPNKRRGFMIPHIGQACRDKDMHYIQWGDQEPGAPRRAHHRSLRRRNVRLSGGALRVDGVAREDGAIDHRCGRLHRLVGSGNDPRRVERARLEEEPSGDQLGEPRSRSPDTGRHGEGAQRDPLRQRERQERHASERAAARGKSRRLHGAHGQGRHRDGRPLPRPLVFPIGAGPDFGGHYLDAVRTLRERYPRCTSSAATATCRSACPKRKMLNFTFVALSMLAGCDSLMIDPIMNPPRSSTISCLRPTR
jgi:hypothetical protein